jgi:hypothetical protein
MKTELLYIGLDVHAQSIAIALAEGWGKPRGEARTYGTIPNDLHALEKVNDHLSLPQRLTLSVLAPCPAESETERRRCSITQPRVGARDERLPWECGGKTHAYPARVASPVSARRIQLFQSRRPSGRGPRVARASQPWAERWNAVGVRRLRRRCSPLTPLAFAAYTEGVSSLSPRLPRGTSGYLGNRAQTEPTPQGLNRNAWPGCNPCGVDAVWMPVPG